MGIISTFIANKANKAAEKIAEASEMTQTQIEKIEAKKEQFLKEKGKMDPQSDETHKLIEKMLGTLGVEVYHAYLPIIKKLYSPVRITEDTFNPENRISYFDITKWVLDTKENYLDKLVNVYQVLSDVECSISLIFHRERIGCTVTMAVVDNGINEDATRANSFSQRLQKAISGNFPGVTFSNEINHGIPLCLQEYEDNESEDEDKSYQPVNIALVTNVATEKSEKFISQSIEKLLDGVIPQKKDQEYTFVLLATPTLSVAYDQSRLSELYTALAPFASWQTNFTYTTTDNYSSSFSGGINLGVTGGVSAGSSIAKSLSNAVTAGASAAFKPLGVGVGASISDAVTSGRTNTQNTGVNASANFGVNFNRSSSVSINMGKNEGITQSFTNHQIKHTLEILDKQMKRLEQSSALGMWKFASYVISKDYNTANNAAHMYLALTQGEESFISQSAVNIWHSDEKCNTDIMLHEISRLQHPIFCLNDSPDENSLMYPTTVDATTNISGRELAYSFNLPKRSVAGFPVIECAEFGRNVVTYGDNNEFEKSLELGNIFHMRHNEDIPVMLSLNSLTSHTFITGSTGAGKSNSVYQILNEAKRNKIPFLVIEPAKGEYKHDFGNDVGATVYGTNPNISLLLRLNPFSFPKDIHVLEHLDRLVEIFNVCWPMYAAMPAVLKSAVEKSYADCGWNLSASTNSYGDDMYPTFADVARNVKQIIDSSEYDTENKGAYKGSLLTRLQSLTNGINGMIFTVDEIKAEELFDENVIIDLSRVGSSETKSLLMGMLVLKLQEYRMTSGNINSTLNHITVLEEAHNLLKRTSTEQPVEGGNLLGKSVEMIANAIAEMRTYGEGFIIADQAPGLLDMAAIRNTNTKIIMRLPDLSDRELVGRAANLNENQITELAKLPRGVAAVYQNEWIQPVLCKVKKYETSNNKYSYTPTQPKYTNNDVSSALRIATLLCDGTKISHSDVLKDVLPYLKECGLTPAMQVTAINMLENPPKEPKFTKLAPVIGSLFPDVKSAVKKTISDSSDETEWTVSADSALRAYINNTTVADNIRRDIIQAIMTDYLYVELGQVNELQRWAERGGLR
ncbi:ATP-binding protein [Ruminococcus sp.]|uniref:ATP-binding protein n=1 Tax=Ruminococcus sp. TaxID=41978 RepID=UPI0025EA458A|nr:ATP-binding protein [Ruminococcus sp.]